MSRTVDRLESSVSSDSPFDEEVVQESNQQQFIYLVKVQFSKLY